MSETIWGVLVAAGTVFVQMAPFLVLGFFLAGWLYVLIPKESVADKLGHQRRLGPLWAALVGIPLPLCSCGVLPFARLLKDRKASPGSIVSFLLTTPQTGADSIAVSASILGWPLTLWKIGTAFVSGILGGFAANALSGRAEDDGHGADLTQRRGDAAQGEGKTDCCSSLAAPKVVSSCCASAHPAPPPEDCCSGKAKVSAPKGSCCETKGAAVTPAVSSCCGSSQEGGSVSAPMQGEGAEVAAKGGGVEGSTHGGDVANGGAACCAQAARKTAKASCCEAQDPVAPPEDGCSAKPVDEASGSCCSSTRPNPKSTCAPPGKLRTALYYGFFQNLGDVSGWLAWGILGAGVIAYAVPEDFFSQTIRSAWIEMLVILAIAIPLYVCATGSIPIGAALAAKGLSAGAVMVFLIAGPAMSAVSLAVLGRILGRRLLLIYLTTIVVLSVASGMAFNALFPNLADSIPPVHHCEHFAWWQSVFAALLGGMLILHFFQRAARKLGKAWLRICPDCLSFCLKGCACCGCAR